MKLEHVVLHLTRKYTIHLMRKIHLSRKIHLETVIMDVIDTTNSLPKPAPLV